MTTRWRTAMVVIGMLALSTGAWAVDRAADERILEQAAREIRMYPYYTIFDRISLSLEGGRLTLTGEVTQPWRAKEIGSIVSRVEGVREVDNRLEVLPLSPFDDEIRRRVARAIYREPVLLRYGIQANPPIHIVVRNGNVTLAGVVNSEVERAVAERAARFAATFFELKNELRVESAAKHSR